MYESSFLGGAFTIGYFLPEIFNRNCELNCDEMVIKNLSGEERMLYGREIFRQVLLVKEERNMFAGVGGNRTKKSLTKERVENIPDEAFDVSLRFTEM